MAALPPLQFEDEVFDVAFHPSTPIVASGLISGDIFLHNYGPAHELKAQIEGHDAACRCLSFSDDGAYLFSASSDKSLQVVDVATGVALYKQSRAHDHSINVIAKLGSEGMLASGDDDGHIKLWDLRQRTSIATYRSHEDFVSDITVVPHKKTIISTGGDGRLCAHNWNTQKSKVSDQMEDELLSVVVMKHHKKVVCGTQGGTINLFSWGLWGDFTDRMTNHPTSVDSLAKINEDILVSGSSDGVLRVMPRDIGSQRQHCRLMTILTSAFDYGSVVSVLPNKVLGVLGEHNAYPIERVRLSGDEAYLASCSHDKTVRFWSTDAINPIIEAAAQGRETGAYYQNSDMEDDDDDEDEDEEDKENLADEEADRADERMDDADGDTNGNEEEVASALPPPSG
ncbi:uncharacterized protein MONBRDRAFT_21907 [Monosiga brevicollis MX1]|uniref:Uncharacterized protein n=1 Tax=Monosiga brevicollis TaxID=81824 RepID=A9UNZ0_MONBE|nr:uncharacterized protein MONBRDRAFT_21907 [Monosiga brevicollis MX1]EDQ92783.1 predicted protein [Monosiga brevicollis MX1]|eukprot:XP_001742545.1 hypothetical protein [Monosiga brevicollis MX1]